MFDLVEPTLMRELISPAQSEMLMLLLAALLSVGAGVWGLKAAGQRGMVGFLLGPLLWLLWRAHVYVTRYDPQTGYLGLEKVSVLLAEVVAFTLIGAGLGIVWRKLSADEHNKEQPGHK